MGTLHPRVSTPTTTRRSTLPLSMPPQLSPPRTPQLTLDTDTMPYTMLLPIMPQWSTMLLPTTPQWSIMPLLPTMPLPLLPITPLWSMPQHITPLLLLTMLQWFTLLPTSLPQLPTPLSMLSLMSTPSLPSMLLKQVMPMVLLTVDTLLLFPMVAPSMSPTPPMDMMAMLLR